ncbi:MAG: hypothetical protein ACOY0T_30505 [Myxococcota bacterium]
MGRKRQLGALVCLLVAIGCGDQHNSGTEPVAAGIDGLSRTCASSWANAQGSGRFRYTSPRTYGQASCGKGVVVDWDAVGGVAGAPNGGSGAAAGTSSGGSFGGAANNTVQIDWADNPLTTQTACEAAWLGAYHFSEDVNGNWVATDFSSDRGDWTGSACVRPHVAFSNIAPRARIAASARTAQTSSAPTRILTMVFAPP